MRALILAFLVCISSVSWAQNAEWSVAQEERLQHLLGQLKCVVCAGQSLRQSDAVLAQDIRLLIKQEIQSGSTDEKILQQLTQRYGEQILLAPPLSLATYGLWLAPLILLGLALNIFYRRPREANV